MVATVPLRELEAVLATAEHLSFRRAARATGLSPSALSHAVASLEARLGVRLFHRTTRSVSLTEAGQRFTGRIAPALGTIDEAVREAAVLQTSLSGRLRINSSTAALRFVMPTLAAFLAEHARLRIDLIADDRLVDIVADGFDAGVRLAERVPRDMISIPCSPELRFVVVGSPDYLARHGTPHSPDEIATRPCIARRLADGRAYAWEFERHGEATAVAVDGPLAADHEQAMLEGARQGLGLAYLRSWTAADDLAAGRLVEVLGDWTPPHPGFRLYYAGRRHQPAALRALVARLRAAPPG